MVESCVHGACTPAPHGRGHLPADDVHGDCNRPVCEDDGKLSRRESPADIEDDGDPCSIDTCNGGVPAHEQAPTGTRCGDQGMCTRTRECKALMGMSTSGRRACVWFGDGTATCWGGDEHVKIPPTIEHSILPVPVPLPRIRAMAASDHHECAILEGGTVQCRIHDWSMVQGRRHNPGELDPMPAFAPVEGVQNAAQIVISASTGCALSPPSKVFCWNLDAPSTGSVRLKTNSVFTKLALGGARVCAVTSAGTLECDDTNGPQQTAGEMRRHGQGWSSVRDVTMDSYLMCVLLEGGEASCQGSFFYNEQGHLNDKRRTVVIPRPERINMGPASAIVRYRDGLYAVIGDELTEVRLRGDGRPGSIRAGHRTLSPSGWSGIRTLLDNDAMVCGVTESRDVQCVGGNRRKLMGVDSTPLLFVEGRFTPTF
jgi:hypothetical protein